MLVESETDYSGQWEVKNVKGGDVRLMGEH